LQGSPQFPYHERPFIALKTMEISNEHNLAVRELHADRRYGIRVTLPATDPFINLVGADWQTEHWFATQAERDAAMLEMGRRHRYSRIGDIPTIILEAVLR
jgi:hypothetical protein